MAPEQQHSDDVRALAEKPGADDVEVKDAEKTQTRPEENADSAETKTGAEVSGEGSGDEKEFKEGGYGWVVVLCVFLINAHTWGLNSSYAVFLAYYLNSGQFDGESPITFAFVGGLSFSIALLVSPLAMNIIRLIGNQRTLGIGVVIQAGALIGASFSYQIWHLLLSQGVGFGVGMGLAFNSTAGVVPQWFYRRRSFASALATGGSGIGGLIYSLGTNAMIDNIGLAWAFRILAILSFVVNGTCCLLFRDRNKATGSVLVTFHWDLFRRVEFWLFLSWGFFSLFGYVIVIFSLPDYAQSVGFSASQGSLVAAMLNLSQGIGRPLIGLVSDRWGRINICGISTLLAGLSTLLLWIPAGQHYAGLIVYSLFGAFAGSFWSTVAPVGAEVVGIQLLPSALSISWLVLVLPGTFAQPIALVIKDPGMDGYLGVQLLTGFVYIVAFISMWLLRAWKLRELEDAGLAAEERRAAEQNDGDDEHGDGEVVRRAPSRVSTRTSSGRILLRGFFSLKDRI